jgi:hypothetical protein
MSSTEYILSTEKKQSQSSRALKPIIKKQIRSQSRVDPQKHYETVLFPKKGLFFSPKSDNSLSADSSDE